MKYLVLFLSHYVLLQTAEPIKLRRKWLRWNETNVTFGETIGLIESVSLMMCLAKCQETSGCVAAHVNEYNSKCELSAYYPPDGTKSATPRNGWTVYFKEECKEGWVVFEESCYFFGDKQLTFHEAETFCKELDENAQLANIETAAEKNFIKDAILSWYGSFTGFWFGMTDENTEGDWRHFPSEEKATYFNWGVFDPDKGRDANCVTFFGFYQWSDESCSTSYRSICEKKKQ